ncbi:hemY protein [Alcanivorax hongdengensis A-11-3]|uniref:HemY protein n=1 Tax=Alcanivorax hongdengensis A-11-3 TaxID=1177179 RepID=L0WI07_9GAMM|nr:heme biosynthesis HemY N-terminal domain-containing protein [Alcanivorax hongdengensis]EKF75455.1 hemY protein [Alcanivorax hongdengensis A-11-3]
MKRIVLLIVVVLLAALALGRWMAADSGYVLIIRDDLQVDMTLGFVLLALLVGALSLVILTLLANAAWNAVEPIRATRRWKKATARRRLYSGFLQLVDGEHERAERLLVASAQEGDWPLAGWLLAAESARERGDVDGSQRYLEKAGEDRRGRLVAGLMKARFALADGYPQQAREELKVLADMAPRNRRILETYADVLESEKDWAALCELMPRLKRVFGDADQARRERRAWLARVQEAARKPGFNDADSRRDELARLWKTVPLSLKNDPAMVARYAGFMAQLGAGGKALELVRHQQERDWDDRLPPVLEAIDDVAPDNLLQVLEGWLANRPGNAAVLITAGRVALKARLWGKAQGFFEAAANSSQSATALAELSRLYQSLGDSSKMQNTLERRARLLAEQLPDLPQP